MSDAREQFEQLFNGCYDAVYRYAARRVEPAAVQDVVAETFLIAWRRQAELDGQPLPWLLGIARRVASTQRRGSDRRDALQQRLRAEHPSVEGDAAGERDLRLVAALAALGERDREALLLVVWDGLEHRVAAQVMGCSTGAFTVRVHRARRRLQRALSSAETSSIEIGREVRSLL